MNLSFEQQRKKGAQEAESFIRRVFPGVEIERHTDQRYSVERYIIWTRPAHIIDISDEALAECFPISDHLYSSGAMRLLPEAVNNTCVLVTTTSAELQPTDRG